MKCEEIKEQIYLLTDEAADSPARKNVEQHLHSCPGCREIYEKLKAIDAVISQPVSIPNTAQLDRQVMAAFHRRHQQEKPQTTQKQAWWSGVFGLSQLPKATAAFAALLLISALSLAFQLGRLSVESKAPTLPSQTEAAKQPAPIPMAEKSQIAETPSAMNLPSLNDNKIIVTKFIKVPIIKERIIAHTIYLKQPPQRFEPEVNFSNASEKENQIVNISAQKDELTPRFNVGSPQENNPKGYQEVDLKGYQVVSDSKPVIIKKGETNER